jgi:hypothetical protein
MSEIKDALKLALADYNKFKSKSSDFRWTYLEQLASKLNELDGKGKNHHYKILLQCEMTKDHFH